MEFFFTISPYIVLVLALSVILLTLRGYLMPAGILFILSGIIVWHQPENLFNEPKTFSTEIIQKAPR